jgi:hypothetical protein
VTTAQALQSIVGSLAIILALVVQSYVARKFGARNAEKLEKKIEVVHDVVNGNHEAALTRIDQLAEALTDAGVAVPPKPPQQPTPQPEGA